MVHDSVTVPCHASFQTYPPRRPPALIRDPSTHITEPPFLICTADASDTTNVSITSGHIMLAEIMQLPLIPNHFSDIGAAVITLMII